MQDLLDQLENERDQQFSATVASYDKIEKISQYNKKIGNMLALVACFSSFNSSDERRDAANKRIAEYLLTSLFFTQDIMILLQHEDFDNHYVGVFGYDVIRDRLNPKELCQCIIDRFEMTPEMGRMIYNAIFVPANFWSIKGDWEVLNMEQLFVTMCIQNKMSIDRFNFLMSLGTNDFQIINSSEIILGIYCLIYYGLYESDLFAQLEKYTKGTVRDFKRECSWEISEHTHEDGNLYYINEPMNHPKEYLPEEILFKTGRSNNFISPEKEKINNNTIKIEANLLKKHLIDDWFPQGVWFPHK